MNEGGGVVFSGDVKKEGMKGGKKTYASCSRSMPSSSLFGSALNTSASPVAVSFSVLTFLEDSGAGSEESSSSLREASAALRLRPLPLPLPLAEEVGRGVFLALVVLDLLVDEGPAAVVVEVVLGRLKPFLRVLYCPLGEERVC